MPRDPLSEVLGPPLVHRRDSPQATSSSRFMLQFISGEPPHRGAEGSEGQRGPPENPFVPAWDCRPIWGLDSSSRVSVPG